MSEKVQKPGIYMFNSVQTHPKSRHRITRRIQFTFRLLFVKRRFKGDTSETSFRSLCKMAFLAPRTGHISRYSCPFDLVPSRIDSCKCPIQNRGLGSQYILLTQNPKKWPCFWPKKSPKPPKKKRSKRVKNVPKRCQIDATTMAKSFQSDTKMAQKWSKITPKSPYVGPILVPKVPETTRMSRKGAKKGQNGPETSWHVQKCPKKTLEFHLRHRQAHTIYIRIGFC